MALPPIPANFTVGDRTGIVGKLNQIIAALNYLASAASNPVPLVRALTGTVTTDANGAATVTWSPPFPTATVAVLAQRDAAGGTQVLIPQASTYTTSSVSVIFVTANTAAGIPNTACPYALVAFGY